MATEADTSGYDPISTGQQRYTTHQHHHQHQQLRHSHISSTGLQTNAESNFYRSMNKANSLSIQMDDDDDNDDNDKLISVDDFDESSENDESSRCSLGFTSAPSDSTVNSSSSPRSGNTSTHNKMRKKGGLASKCMDDKELQQLRLKINSRERKRMHDLNSALDGLREVMPYANGPSVRKLSKIATLLLAKNYILMLNSSLEEMKKLVSDVYHSHTPPRATGHLGGVPQPHPAPSTTLQPPPPPPQAAPPPTRTPTSAVSGSVSSGGISSKRSEGSSSPVTPSSTSSEGNPTALRVSPPATSVPDQSLNQASPQLHPQSILHNNPLPSHSSGAPHFLPLSVPGMRAQLPGLSPHEISALATSLHVPKTDLPHSYLPLHVVNTHDRLHALSRWPAPCTCAQCLTASSPLAYGLHLGRFANPLLTSAALPRKG